MELKPPRKKKKTPGRLSKGPPLPIFVESLSGEYLTDDSASPVFRGCFNGYSVVVDNPNEMKMLYEMGNFGKGSLSRSFPNFGRRINDKPPVINETQWTRRKEWSDKLKSVFACQISEGADVDERDEENMESETTTDKPDSAKHDEKSSNPWKDGDVLVIADLDKTCSDLNPRLESELIERVVEVLHLTLEEAFFLSYALGCLEIVNLVDNLLSPNDLWNLFRSAQNDFVENYVAYHHFRAKGWIVKSGLKYGGHHLLYSKGPAFYHASYIVVVENIDKPGEEFTDDAKLGWDKYSALNRVAEQSNKELLICRVKWPSSDPTDYKNKEIISHFRVSDCIFGRWNASAKPLLDD